MKKLLLALLFISTPCYAVVIDTPKIDHIQEETNSHRTVFDTEISGTNAIFNNVTANTQASAPILIAGTYVSSPIVNIAGISADSKYLRTNSNPAFNSYFLPTTPLAYSSGQVLCINQDYTLEWRNQSTGGSGTPGGANTQIQFNDSASFGGDADFTWNKTTNTLTVAGDTDVTTTLGRAKIGYDGATADEAGFAHFDQMGASTLALKQTAAGLTMLNAPTGQKVYLTNNGTTIATIDSTSLTMAAGKTASGPTVYGNILQGGGLIGMLKGSAETITTAVSGTDYQPPMTASAPITIVNNDIRLSTASPLYTNGSNQLYVGDSDTVNKGIASFSNSNFSVSGGAVSIKTQGVGATELASTTVTAGSYTSTNLTVDEDGRITAASNGTSGISDQDYNDIMTSNGLQYIQYTRHAVSEYDQFGNSFVDGMSTSNGITLKNLTYSGASNYYVGLTTGSVIESYTGATNGTDEVFGPPGASQEMEAQGFKVPTNSTIYSCSAKLKKTLSPTDNVVFRVETDNAGVPSGTLVDANATGNLSAASLTGTETEYTVVFNGTFSLTAGTQYHLVRTRDGVRDTSNYTSWSIETTGGGFADGVAKRRANGTWSNAGAADGVFYFKITSASASTGHLDTVAYNASSVPTKMGGTVYLSKNSSNITLSVSRDGGVTFATPSIVQIGVSSGTKAYYKTTTLTDVSSQGSATSPVVRVSWSNSDSVKLLGLSGFWK